LLGIMQIPFLRNMSEKVRAAFASEVNLASIMRHSSDVSSSPDNAYDFSALDAQISHQSFADQLLLKAETKYYAPRTTVLDRFSL
jgi:hypothetical protein